jgi:hypothetical protein
MNPRTRIEIRLYRCSTRENGSRKTVLSSPQMSHGLYSTALKRATCCSYRHIGHILWKPLRAQQTAGGFHSIIITPRRSPWDRPRNRRRTATCYTNALALLSDHFQVTSRCHGAQVSMQGFEPRGACDRVTANKSAQRAAVGRQQRSSTDYQVLTTKVCCIESSV